MPTEFVMLPPQTDKTREWGARLAAVLPELEVIVAEDMARAEQAIAMAESAFGTIPPALLRQARRLRWLQAPQAAPPAGYYYPELIAHPVERAANQARHVHLGDADFLGDLGLRHSLGEAHPENLALALGKSRERRLQRSAVLGAVELGVL